MIQTGADSRIACQHRWPVIRTDAKIRTAQQQAIVACAAGVSTAGEVRMEVAVAGAAHRDVISAWREQAVKMRVAAVRSAVILRQETVVYLNRIVRIAEVQIVAV